VNLRVVRDVNTGFGDGLAAAFEMVATPAMFGFFGYLIDQKLGIGPVFLLSFSLFVFGYECWKLFARYNEQMDRHLEEMRTARRSPIASPISSEDGEEAGVR
jgi:hypothetical protein